MSSHMFYGDYRHGKDPLAFLSYLETTLANLPHLSEPEKCQRFYLRCKSDSDAEDWYENLEKNSPAAVASWSTLVVHFRVKWLHASPNTLLEIPKPVTTTKPDTATPIACETPTTTTTTATPTTTNTAALAIYETTTTTPQQLDRIADARCVIATSTPIPTQQEHQVVTTASTSTTTAATATDTITEIEEQDNNKPGVRREEEGKGVENQNERGEQEVERSEVDTAEREDPRIEETQSDERFDWAREVDNSLGLSPAVDDNSGTVMHIQYTPQPVPMDLTLGQSVPTNTVPVDPNLGDVATNPAGVALANAVPTDRTPVNHSPAVPTPTNPDPGDVAPDPARSALTNTATNHIPNDLASAAPTLINPAPAPINAVPDDVVVDPDRTARTTAIPVDPDPVSPVLTEAAPANPIPADPVRIALASAVPADPNPGDVATDASVALAKTAPTNLILTSDPAHVKLDSTMPDVPIPVPIEPDPTPTALVGPTLCDVAIDPVCTALASVVPADSMPTDPNHVVRVNPIHITPTKPVHIDPVSVTFRALAPILFHLILFSSSVVRESQRESFRSRTRTFACLGGALVTVSLGSLHHKLCSIRGPGRVSESFRAMFSICP
jgi:hypothetical protein